MHPNHENSPGPSASFSKADGLPGPAQSGCPTAVLFAILLVVAALVADDDVSRQWVWEVGD